MRKLLNCVGVAVGILATASAFAAEGPSFVSKPLLAGRALLTADGFVGGFKGLSPRIPSVEHLPPLVRDDCLDCGQSHRAGHVDSPIRGRLRHPREEVDGGIPREGGKHT